MTRSIRAVLGAALLLLLSACGGPGARAVMTEPAAANPLDAYPLTPAGASPGASGKVRALAAGMGRGINFGNMLESPKEGDWGHRVEDAYIDLVALPGFVRTVRLPVRWSNHAGLDAAAVIDPRFFERVDSIVDRLLNRGVTVVLNMHHYRQLDGDPLDPGEARVDPAVVDLRFLAMWRQIARRYADRGDRLIFELYNEPHGDLEPRWNALFSRGLRVVRESNATRVVVVGPTFWNSATHLDRLVLPPDPNLLLTVHHYEPFDFTHQGAEWIQPPKPLGVSCCDDKQREVITSMLDLAVRESARLGYPVFVGEFGAYSKAPQDARIRYLRLMRQAMESRGLPWMYWELAAGFGVFDPATQSFRADMKEALYGD